MSQFCSEGIGIPRFCLLILESLHSSYNSEALILVEDTFTGGVYPTEEELSDPLLRPLEGWKANCSPEISWLLGVCSYLLLQC